MEEQLPTLFIEIYPHFDFEFHRETTLNTLNLCSPDAAR